MKVVASIYFEQPVNDDDKLDVEKMSAEEIQRVLVKWKAETEKVIRNEISLEAENLKIEFQLVTE